MVPVRTREPGWYADPQGERPVRFWDGDAWTSYTQPLPPVEQRTHDQTTALEDYPYLSDAQLRAPHEPRTVATWSGAPVLAPTSGPPTPPRRGGLILAIAGGAAAVLVVGVLLSRAFGGTTTADPTPTAGPSGTGTAPGVTVVTDEVGTDEESTTALPAGGELHVTLDVAQAGPYLVGAEAAEAYDRTDLRMTITGPALAEPLVLDDREGDLAAFEGGEWSDPGWYLDLDAGQYTLVISERAGEADDVTVSAASVTVVDAPLDADTPVSVPDLGHTVVRIPHEGAGRLTVDVRATTPGADAMLLHREGPRTYSVHDRDAAAATATGASEEDPLLELDVDAGSTFVVVSDSFWDEAEMTVRPTLG